jgi:hypothetical protein
VAVAALVVALGWVCWQAFAVGGVLSNASKDGPQNADAFMVVLAAVTLVLTMYSIWSDQRSRHQERHASAAGTAPGGVGSGPAMSAPRARLPRLGDDPALAVETLRVHLSIPLPANAPLVCIRSYPRGSSGAKPRWCETRSLRPVAVAASW